MKDKPATTVQSTDPSTAPQVPAADAVGTSPSYEELLQQVAVLNEKITALEDHISISDAENERLLATLKKLEESGRSLESLATDAAGNTVTLPTFEVAKKQYRFTKSQFKLDGKLITAEAAAKDATLLKRLVDMRVGFIQEII